MKAKHKLCLLLELIDIQRMHMTLVKPKKQSTRISYNIGIEFIVERGGGGGQKK